MTHRRIIIEQKIVPNPDALATAADHGEMTAVVTFSPPDTMTDAQIGNAVERITRRLNKLADD